MSTHEDDGWSERDYWEDQGEQQKHDGQLGFELDDFAADAGEPWMGEPE